MNIVARRGVVVVEDMRADPVQQRRVQRIEPLAATEHARGALPGIWVQHLERDLNRVFAASADRTSDVIQDRAASLMLDV